MLRTYLQDHILITDGAMGTYYAQVTEDRNFCELANINNSATIENIHKEYIASGAKLIRTNTFSANTATLNMPMQEVKAVIVKGYEIAAKAAAAGNAFVAANIGPISGTVGEKGEIVLDGILDEYKAIVDIFLELGADIFNFETFNNLEHVQEIANYIKTKQKSCFILTQFALTVDGTTRKGIKAERIVKEVKMIKDIDAYGFNCGIGPTHLCNIIKGLMVPGDIVSVLPNAGYPELINERTVYVQNPAYFAQILMKTRDLGVKIMGGCCGTTPAHIKKITEYLNTHREIQPMTPAGNAEISVKTETVPNNFYHKMRQGKFLVAVELDPPFDSDLEKVLQGAKVLKESGVDIITIAESPMGKVRADSIVVAAKISREIGIETLPHLCCRDKNLVSIRAGLLAAHMEGIRNVLAVTGDPIPEEIKGEVKSVFNINSFNLIDMISEMNKNVFETGPFNIGGALNVNVFNKSGELARMIKKAKLGATFFLTQPVFSDEALQFLTELKKAKNVKILGGLMPIVTYRNAQFINNELPGITIPQAYVDRFDINMRREEAEAVGIEVAVEIANKMKAYVDGFYVITPFNRYEMIVKILKSIMP